MSKCNWFPGESDGGDGGSNSDDDDDDDGGEEEGAGETDEDVSEAAAAAGQEKTGDGAAEPGVGEEMEGAEEEFTDKAHESQFCLESNFIREGEEEDKRDSQPPGEEDAKGEFHGNAGRIITTSLPFVNVGSFISHIHNIKSHRCKTNVSDAVV